MITSKIKELAIAKAKAANLEAAIARELPHELASLPARFGFPDLAAFVQAVQALAGGKRRGRSTSKKAQPLKRRSAKIADAIKAQVKKLVKSGKTGAEIAKTTGISLASVQNIKKSLGLVNAKKSAPMARKSKPVGRTKVKPRRGRVQKSQATSPTPATVSAVPGPDATPSL